MSVQNVDTSLSDNRASQVSSCVSFIRGLNDIKSCCLIHYSDFFSFSFGLPTSFLFPIMHEKPRSFDLKCL